MIWEPGGKQSRRDRSTEGEVQEAVRGGEELKKRRGRRKPKSKKKKARERKRK